MRKSVTPAVRTRMTPELLGTNAILSALEPQLRVTVCDRAELVDLAVRDPIYQPNEPIGEVFFPFDCVLSIVTRMKDGNSIEIGTVGREGCSGIPLILGATTTANESYCQVAGLAVKMDADFFQELRQDQEFDRTLDRFVQAYVNMLGQHAACNRLHSVYERAARWLLMTKDRVGRNDIGLTHEYLAMMLGTQRSGVTIAAGTLQQAGFIRYARGVITILDPEGLEGASCECYEIAREQFGGLMRSTEAHF